MTRKLLALLALALVFAVVKAPAALLGGLLGHFSGGGLVLQQPEGSLWQGRGILASRDAGGRSLTPWLPLAWRFDTGSLARLAIGWDLSTSGSPLGHVELGPAGLALGGLNLHAPAGAALAAIPHAAARAGWQGDLSIAAPRWNCPADGRCSGEASLLWRGAGSALFPGRSFGDYRLQINAAAGSLRFSLQTLTGPIIASGQGEAPYGQLPRFDGQLSGDAELLRRLPAIAGGAAKPGLQPGHFEIHWPPR